MGDVSPRSELESEVRLRTAALPLLEAKVAVAPDKFTRGWEREDVGAVDAYEIVPLEAALQRVYATDAHLVAYVVDWPASHQPRLKKAWAPAFQAYTQRAVTVQVLLCDVDNPGHAETTAEMIAAAGEELDTEGVYWTKRGRRLVQPLERPISALEAEPVLEAWLGALERRGFRVDWACRDWTRHFRLPNVRRDGKPYTSPRIDLARMRPITVEPTALPLRPRRAASSTPRPAPVTAPMRASSPAAAAPGVWLTRADAIARVAGVASGERHRFSLALAGALLEAGAPPEAIPAIVGRVASGTGMDPRHHARNAEDTVARARAGVGVTGLEALRGSWPLAAAALEYSAPPAAPVTAERPTDDVAPDVPLARLALRPPALAPSTLEDVLRTAPDGLTLLGAECGLGKTRAAIAVAGERARRPYRSGDAKGERAPAHSKTAIAVDKTELALQVMADVAAAGVSVRRLFGPLSVEGERGCLYRASAEAWVAGGQSLQKDFCEGRRKAKCSHYDACDARRGSEGPSSARVIVGPHAMLEQLDAAAGSTGLLVIDEPPALLETEWVSEAALKLAERHIGDFDRAYGQAMLPVLEDLRAWVRGGEAPDLEELRARVPDEPRPPVRWVAAHRARELPSYARAIGSASRTCRLVQAALTEPGATLALDEREEEGEDGALRKVQKLWVTMPRAALQKALRRDGQVVVMDAAVDLQAPLYARVVGYDPPLHRFAAADGAPVARTLFRVRASRSAWLGRRGPPASFDAAVRRVLAWADGLPLGIATFKALEGRVRELAAGYPARLEVGHYGGLDGLNGWADLDALATLGDPRPNLLAAGREAAYGAAGDDARRASDLARAELEQAHGRLRVVHRTRPARACHVGQLWPRGSGWDPDRVAVVDLRDSGRPPRPPTVRRVRRVDVATWVAGRDGDVEACAAELNVHPATLRRWMRGDGAPPDALLDRIALPA